MIELVGIDLNKVVTFDSVSVDFNSNLTYVRGLNLDSDPANPTSNGAGKTLLFSSIANVLYKSTPLALRKNKKGILGAKGSSIGVIIRNNGIEYEVIQTGSKYEIYADGNDLGLRTIHLQEEFIRTKIYPISETKFFHTQYVTTQRPYSLQSDSDSNRLQIFGDLFNMDQYSHLKQYFATKLRAIKDDEIRMSMLEQQHLQVSKKLKDASSTISKEAYQEAKAALDAVVDKLAAVDKKIQAKLRYQELVRRLVDIEHTLDAYRKSYNSTKSPKDYLKHLKGVLLAAQEWENYSEVLHVYKTKTKRILDKLANITVEGDASPLKELRTSRSKLSEKLSQQNIQLGILEESRVKYLAHRRQLKELTKDIEEYGNVDVELDIDYYPELAEAQSILGLKKLVEHDCGGVCPTCRGDVDLDKIKNTVKRAEARYRDLKIKITLQKLLLKKQKLLEENVVNPESKIESIKEEVQKLSSKIEQIDSTINALEEKQSLVKQLEGFEKPSKPSVERPDVDIEDVQSQVSLCQKIQMQLVAKTTLIHDHSELADIRSAKAATSLLKQLDTAISDLELEKTQLTSEKAEHASIVDAYARHKNVVSVYTKELSTLAEQIEVLKPMIARKKILTVLDKAYGPKGIKATVANDICRLFESNLNHYRDLIYIEPFAFTVNASETGISILVDRNNGKANSISDVREMSGAESNAFRLLALISLLPLLPSNQRSDFLLLDEPTSHMCPVSRSVFNERFLPVLRQIVPHVFVITPHEDDTAPESAQWLVIKEQGVSRLETK